MKPTNPTKPTKPTQVKENTKNKKPVNKMTEEQALIEFYKGLLELL